MAAALRGARDLHVSPIHCGSCAPGALRHRSLPFLEVPLRRVYSVPTLAEAWLLKDLLAGAGIPASVFNQHGIGAVGELPQDSGWPQLWIHRDDQYQRARDLLLAHESSAVAGEDRACGRCGETNPFTFEICWSCGADMQR